MLDDGRLPARVELVQAGNDEFSFTITIRKTTLKSNRHVLDGGVVSMGTHRAGLLIAIAFLCIENVRMD